MTPVGNRIETARTVQLRDHNCYWWQIINLIVSITFNKPFDIVLLEYTLVRIGDIEQVFC